MICKIANLSKKVKQININRHNKKKQVTEENSAVGQLNRKVQIRRQNKTKQKRELPSTE